MDEVHRHPAHVEFWDLVKGNRMKESTRYNVEDSVKTTPRGKSSRLHPDLLSREEARESYIDLPIQPPYAAHLANLSYDTTEDDIREFFVDCQKPKVRMYVDNLARKPGTSAYVYFASQRDLRKLFSDTYDNCSLKGNGLIISIARPRKLPLCTCQSLPELR